MAGGFSAFYANRRYAQRKSDADYLKLLEPEHGMPGDTKFELRTSALGKVAKP